MNLTSKCGVKTDGSGGVWILVANKPRIHQMKLMPDPKNPRPAAGNSEAKRASISEGMSGVSPSVERPFHVPSRESTMAMPAGGKEASPLYPETLRRSQPAVTKRVLGAVTP